jgi:hypothetical protein
MKKIVLIISLALIVPTLKGQSHKSPARFFGEPILTDSLSTVFIPTRYNEDFLASNKIALSGEYHANIVAYDFETDSYKKLFETDTFIESFRSNNDYTRYSATTKPNNITSEWVFLLVKSKDANNSGRIDERDPSILFAVSPNGQNLKQLTDEKENVVSFQTFDQQGFILLRIQKDSDGDKSFKNEDKEYYLKKVSLSDLAVGNGIELK